MTDASDALLDLPLGAPGAGRIRYGAAMALYQRGQISAAELEVWRIASASDTRPAAEVLAAHGLPERPLARVDPAVSLPFLMQEASIYLAALATPGASELRRLLARLPAEAAPTRPRTFPVVEDHLPVALAALRQTHPALAAALASASQHLAWAHLEPDSADQIGPAFMAHHGFCPLIGPDAPFAAKEAEFGLLLIAPHILYRDHCHAAPELYLPLTGPHGWRFGPDRPLIRKPAHLPVWIDPHRPHLTKVGPLPFLAFYSRPRPLDAPARILTAHDWPRLEALRLDPTP